jgi:hypothetical protein
MAKATIPQTNKREENKDLASSLETRSGAGNVISHVVFWSNPMSQPEWVHRAKGSTTAHVGQNPCVASLVRNQF